MVGAWKSNINGNDKVSTYVEQVYHDGKKIYENEGAMSCAA